MGRRLRLAFDTAEAFRTEFERNITNGGAFVRTPDSFEVRALVEVEIELSYSGERVVLDAEIVHRVPGAGVAVQFLRPAVELRDEFARFLSRLEPSRPNAAAKPQQQIEPAPDSPLEGEDAELEIDVDLLESIEPASQRADPLVDVDDRRKAQRTAARVPARLDSTNVSLEGRTRDLSSTGALISADASELPIGKRVRLALQHPESGEQLEVAGVVSRHVHGDGTVAAVGVKFTPRPEEEAVLSGYVREIKDADARRLATGISGRIEELGMANLIQMLGNSSPSGTLTATRGSEEAVVAFDAGTLRYVRLGGLSGVKALVRMLGWADGEFQFHSVVDKLADEDAPMSLTTALLEATRRVDEAAGSGVASYDLKTVFRVDLSAAGSLSKLEEAVIDLATAGFTLRRIVDVIPEDDAEILLAVERLTDRLVLTPEP